MIKYINKLIALSILSSLLTLIGCAGTPSSTVVSHNPVGESERITHKGQDIFLSGMNLAWINFGRDLTKFNEGEFVRALDEISAAGGNSLRWWIHVNGSSTPLWEGHFAAGMPEGTLENLERALDLAWERGLTVILSLWSFDMLQDQAQMDPVRNKKFLEDPEAVAAYLKNSLTPMVEAVGDHPAVVAWEVFNEPEGMVEGIGWTPTRVSMKTIQSFVNRVAGTIHAVNIKAKVTNGTKDITTQTYINGFTNYYSDEQLLSVGGDPLGYLDFYQVHYYPAHMGEALSPFHQPKSKWELDRPLIIGEFPAIGIVDYGRGFKPETMLSPQEAYEWAINNGYAGALAWTWTAHEPELGSTANTQPGMMSLSFNNRKSIMIDNGNVDRIPVKTGEIDRLLVYINNTPIDGYADLSEIFYDNEQGSDLNFSIRSNSNPELITSAVEGSKINLNFAAGLSGKSTLIFTAEDRSGNRTDATMEILVVDPDKGNIALFKPVTASSVENESHNPELLNDGLDTTRYSSQYIDNQWVEIDLEGTFKIDSATLNWEAAYGKSYSFLVSKDGLSWTELFSAANESEGQKLYDFEPVEAAYIRIKLNKRGTEWGFSLWEIEINGERI